MRLVMILLIIGFTAAAAYSWWTRTQVSEPALATEAVTATTPTSRVTITVPPFSVLDPPANRELQSRPNATATPPPKPTLAVQPMPLPTPPDILTEPYVVQAGDTLGGISWAYDISIDDLVALNGLESASVIINVGQTLYVPLDVSRTGPLIMLLPDSEVVYSPAYVGFDVAAFIEAQGGYLATYAQNVNGVPLSGAEIISRLSRQFSVGPRVLLALLEFYGGWVTQPEPPSVSTPLGPANPYADNLFLQLSWTANRLNEGYYGYKRSGTLAVRFRDRSRALVPPRLNAGTAAIQNLLAAHTTWDPWLTQLEPTGFITTYETLFGDPFAHVFNPLIPADLAQPEMRLPWERGKTFYYTGGPHPAYSDGSGWAAIDFGPPDVLGSCHYSKEKITAVANGQVFLGSRGELYLDLDADSHLQTGWVLLYLHTVAETGLESGQSVTAGDPLGVASCEGGISTSSHLHLARRYNGEWMPADSQVPFVLSGWRVKAGLGQYEGGMLRHGVLKTACECWSEENSLVSE